MNTKKILGLDLGTNSIGWALIEESDETGKLLGLGSRIVPMDANMLSDFSKGRPTSKNVERRSARSARRLLQRYKLRRSRLVITLQMLGWLLEFRNTKELHNFLCSSPSDSSRPMTSFELYELRAKAVDEFVSDLELARILYHFNQRRGFLSNRKVRDESELKGSTEEVDEAEKGTLKTYEVVVITSIEEDLSGKKKIYNVELADGRVGTAYQPIPFLKDKGIELLITQKNSKQWGLSYFFQLPKKSDWNYRKHHINKLVEESGLTVGQFYHQELCKNPHFRTKDNIILREKYILEFDLIWNRQVQFREEAGILEAFDNKQKLMEVAEVLYKNNKERQNLLLKKGLKYTIKEDIIYYQRPLKSQKDSIGNCRFEPDKKVIPLSHPLYQEFRILDKVNNLRIYNTKDEDCTSMFMTDEVRKIIIEKFNDQKTISPKSIQNLLIPKHLLGEFYLSENDEKRPFKGNETLVDIKNAIIDDPRRDEILRDKNKIEMIWHIIYSLNKTEDVIHALTRPKNQLALSENAARNLASISYPAKYGSISARAIKKLMPLMKTFESWQESNLSPHTILRIESIFAGEFIDGLPERVRFYIEGMGYKELRHFNALPYWIAASVVYNSHTNIETFKKWNSPEDIELLPKNYLRNPIVQQITNEALQLVGDVWKKYGSFHEIRIELARDLKNSARERESISNNQIANRALNESIKRKLIELGQPISNSDKYRIWLESFDPNEVNEKEAIDGYLKYLKPDGKWKPSASDISKYKMWEEQSHISPYTGKPIPLSSLFNPELYEVDHIIPRQRFYDDSVSNKVIVEAYVNKDKGTPGRNLTAWEYITSGPAQLGINILDEENYVGLVNRIFRGSKRKKLLLKEIPVDFVERQKKDTQFITLEVRSQLARIVGIENVHTSTGGITDHLREHWGIAHLFKELLLPRFESMETKLKAENPDIRLIERVFDRNQNKHILKLEGYSKRLDHRHHAADALVIACTKPSHIKRLNDLNKIYQSLKRDSRELIQHSMNIKKAGGSWAFEKPWPSFLEDAKIALETCIVSVKNRNRLLTKGVNKYIKFDSQTGRKKEFKQIKGKMLSVRGPLHNPQPYGEINVIEKENLSEVVKWYATVVVVDTVNAEIRQRFAHEWQYLAIRNLFAENSNDLNKVKAWLKKNPFLIGNKELKEISVNKKRYVKRTNLAALTGPKLKCIADKQLRYELILHVETYGNGDLKRAFSADGLAALNQNRKIPITAVKIIEGETQEVGESIGKQRLERKSSSNRKLHINTAGNFAFAIYESEEEIRNCVWPRKREYEIVSFYDAVQLKISGEEMFQSKRGMSFFTLSQNDLVYVPRLGETPYSIDWSDLYNLVSRLFIMTQASGNRIYFTPISIAQPIIKDKEFGSQNAIELLDGVAIKHSCIKVKVDRIGNIIPIE